jgi:divalent metal cation (Fe/Co/Zn/Cd) transporter
VDERDKGFRFGLLLEYLGLAYNVLEAILSILFGIFAGSVALVGFGLDSIVESLSGLVLIWRLRKHGTLSKEDEERIERTAVLLVGLTFLILGVYVLFEASHTIFGRIMYSIPLPGGIQIPGGTKVPDPSIPGILIALASIMVMPTLAYLKYRTGKRIGSRALVADSKETLVCAVLSVALLLGLGLNYLFGWWWADPAAGLLIAAFLFKEGMELLSGEED